LRAADENNSGRVTALDGIYEGQRLEMRKEWPWTYRLGQIEVRALQQP
jgi:hypothetical protein